MGFDYRIRPVQDKKEWDEYFAAVQQPHLMQSYAYGEAKKQAHKWHIYRYVLERFGTPLAICQVLEKRLLGLPVASRINRGPLFLDASLCCDVKAKVFQLMRDHWRAFHGGPLLIAPALEMAEENRNILMQLGYKDLNQYCHWSGLIDLAPDADEMKSRLARRWRNRLKSSCKSGLELRVSNSIESVSWMLKRHEENMCWKNFRGPSKGLVAALYTASPDNFLVLQAVRDGEPVAGMALVTYGHTAECYIVWVGKSGREYNCGNILFWNAMIEMKKAGYKWLDLGGYSATEKFGRFKQGMRGTEYKLIGEWLCY